jgi:hypothetical protein
MTSAPPELAIRDELPLVIVRDVSTWPGVVVLCIAAAVYLGWSFSTQQALGDFEIVAFGLLVCLPVFALIGSREIRLYPSWMVVIRRGKVRLDESLDQLIYVRSVPLLDVHWAVFSGRRRVILVSNAPSWAFIVDHCKAHLRRRSTLRQ